MAKIHNTLPLLSRGENTSQKFSSKIGYVYIIQDEMGTLKIGHLCNPVQRIRQLQRCCGLYITRQHISPPCYNYKQIEHILLTRFMNQLRQSEHLQQVSFEEVCETLDNQEFQTTLGMINSSNSPECELTVFLFGKYPIRVFIDEKGNPWFAAKDVCKALNIVWKRNSTLENIPKEWRVGRKCRLTLKNQHGVCGEVEKELTFINEPALYKLSFRSRKEEANTFTNWVASEVLPQIRRKGYYGLYGQIEPSTQSLVNEVAQATVSRIGDSLAPLIGEPVVIAKTQAGKVKRVEVSFQVKFSLEIKEI